MKKMSIIREECPCSVRESEKAHLVSFDFIKTKESLNAMSCKNILFFRTSSLLLRGFCDSNEPNMCHILAA